MDRELLGRPFVIAGASGGRALVLDLSPEALREGITPRMTLSAAEQKVKDLTVLAPDPPAYEKMNRELERIAAIYAPAFENDKQGNLYLDLTGTASLFGPPADCSSHLLREILDQTGIRPAAAVAGNKLVSKVASRAIRPIGLIQIQNGTEAAFLAHQDIHILPGMGPSLLRTAAVTGFREIGELAQLSDGEALTLFGKRGPLLRDTAKGIDTSPVCSEEADSRVIEKQLDFGEDVVDYEIIRGGLIFITENTGIEMRKNKLGAKSVQIKTTYADGVQVTGQEKGKRLYITDKELAEGAERVYSKITIRRLRIRSITLTLGDLQPLDFQPDLFEIEGDMKQKSLQEAADKIRNRYGINALLTGTVLAASKQKASLLLLAGN
jgi:DNA polymerase-4